MRTVDYSSFGVDAEALTNLVLFSQTTNDRSNATACTVL